MRRFVRENSLSLFFGLIFVGAVGALVAQSFVGWHQFNDLQVADHLGAVPWTRCVSSSDFAVDVTENWESEFLTVGAMAVLSIYLRQRGSSQSKPVGQPHDATGVEG